MLAYLMIKSELARDNWWIEKSYHVIFLCEQDLLLLTEQEGS